MDILDHACHACLTAPAQGKISHRRIITRYPSRHAQLAARLHLTVFPLRRPCVVEINSPYSELERTPPDEALLLSVCLSRRSHSLTVCSGISPLHLSLRIHSEELAYREEGLCLDSGCAVRRVPGREGGFGQRRFAAKANP